MVRIMVEGIDPGQVERLAGELAATVENTLKRMFPVEIELTY